METTTCLHFWLGLKLMLPALQMSLCCQSSGPSCVLAAAPCLGVLGPCAPVPGSSLPVPITLSLTFTDGGLLCSHKLRVGQLIPRAVPPGPLRAAACGV